jgi:hypothetical protein
VIPEQAIPARVRSSSWFLVGLVLIGIAVAPSGSLAHPLGNFSISQYAGIRIHRDGVELRYLIDMAEIPTFQEIQDTGIPPEAGHPSLSGYLARKVEALKEGLRLEVDGRRLELRPDTSEVVFPLGAGGLPTLKLGVLYRASLVDPVAASGRLLYRDGNFPDRAGWKEVVAVAGRGVTLVSSSVPAKDRSQELSDYPTDLLNSPPQDLEAHVVFTRDAPATTVAGVRPGGAASAGTARGERPPTAAREPAGAGTHGPMTPATVETPAEKGGAGTTTDDAPLRVLANRQTTPRNAFTT